MRQSFTDGDRRYVKYCLRYAVLVLGKKQVAEYIDTLDAKGNETCEAGGTWPAGMG